MSQNDDTGDHSALRQEEGAMAGLWMESTKKYDVHVSAPIQYESSWTSLGTDGGEENVIETEILSGIRVEREVQFLRPKGTFHPT